MKNKKLVFIKFPSNMSKYNIVNMIEKFKKIEDYNVIFIPDNFDVINYENDKDLIVAHSSDIGYITLDNLVKYIKSREEN